MRNVLDAVHNGKSRVIGQWAQSPPVQLSRGTIDYDGTLTEHASPNFCQTDGMWWGAGRVDRRLGCQEWDQLSAELPNVTGHQLTFDGWCILAHICQICTAIMLATIVREFWGAFLDLRTSSWEEGEVHLKRENSSDLRRWWDDTISSMFDTAFKGGVCHQWHILNGCSVV